jgi:hypothetical protein
MAAEARVMLEDVLGVNRLEDSKAKYADSLG